jgi:hypothetical protein
MILTVLETQLTPSRLRLGVFWYLYGYTALVDFGQFFSFLIYTQSAGLLGRGISPSQGRYLHTEQHNYRITSHRHPCLRPRGHCDRPVTENISEEHTISFRADTDDGGNTFLRNVHPSLSEYRVLQPRTA